MLPETWRDFCETFKISPDRTEIGAKVPKPGCTIEVYVYQLYFVYWSKTQERFCANGRILANRIGLGKTILVLLVYIMERWLTMAFEEINADRKAAISQIHKLTYCKLIRTQDVVPLAINSGRS